MFDLAGEKWRIWMAVAEIGDFLKVAIFITVGGSVPYKVYLQQDETSAVINLTCPVEEEEYNAVVTFAKWAHCAVKARDESALLYSKCEKVLKACLMSAESREEIKQSLNMEKDFTIILV